MKRLWMVLLLSMIVYLCRSQQTDAPMTAEDYYKQSENRNRTGWFLLGGGAVLGFTGVIIPMGKQLDENCWFFCKHENEDLKLALFLTGGLSMVGSIPVFISSGSSYRKGLRLEMKSKRTELPFRMQNVPVYHPAVQLTITL